MASNGFTPLHRGGEGSPMVLVHGFTDTWRGWELLLPALERHHDVLAPTLAGHAGGPPLDVDVSEDAIADALERTMDEAGFETAHIIGNSLGGHLALVLASRGRAETVVALSPAGGWADGDESYKDTLAYFRTSQELVKAAAPHADAIMASAEGRRQATAFTTTNYEHIPGELLAHQLRGAAACEAAGPLLDTAAEKVGSSMRARSTAPSGSCGGRPTGFCCGPAPLRGSGVSCRTPSGFELDGIGHMPQLDVPLETTELILGFTSPDRRR